MIYQVGAEGILQEMAQQGKDEILAERQAKVDAIRMKREQELEMKRLKAEEEAASGFFSDELDALKRRRELNNPFLFVVKSGGKYMLEERVPVDRDGIPIYDGDTVFTPKDRFGTIHFAVGSSNSTIITFDEAEMTYSGFTPDAHVFSEHNLPAISLTREKRGLEADERNLAAFQTYQEAHCWMVEHEKEYDSPLEIVSDEAVMNWDMEARAAMKSVSLYRVVKKASFDAVCDGFVWQPDDTERINPDIYSDRFAPLCFESLLHRRWELLDKEQMNQKKIEKAEMQQEHLRNNKIFALASILLVLGLLLLISGIALGNKAVFWVGVSVAGWSCFLYHTLKLKESLERERRK